MAASTLGEADVQERLRLVAEVFRPSAPIDRRSLFSGRSEQISELFAIVGQAGQHAVVYGERGVGKTSLAGVATEMLRSANMLVARATCDVSDDFGTVWRKALDEIQLSTVHEGTGFAPSSTETWKTASTLLPPDPVAPNDARRALELIAGQRKLVLFLDEFDRLVSQQTRALFADTIKTLSDRVVPVTVVLIGVAESVRDLIAEHASVERALVQVHMPRMTRDELAQIAERGIESARMAIRAEAVRKITTLSQGLPHYTQLLTQLAAQGALAQRRPTVSVRDVEVAVGRALERAQRSVIEAYEDATTDTRRSIYPQVLLACALAPENDYGLFAPADVREPLSRILGRELRTTEFARHLERLSDSARGNVLQKHGAGRTSRFRFVNPLLQPYIAMRGVSEGVVKVKDLA